MQIPLIIYQDENGVYIAMSPTVQWFHTYGDTYEELQKNIGEITTLYQEMVQNKEIDIKQPWLCSLSFISLDKYVTASY